ncbi:MAG TPA: hypothetical protein VKU01_02175 [Bryobacteraceae bacterium]|nr:hypothetical protein [Bryobacteraceae bacterium]
MYINYSSFKKTGIRTFRAPNPWENGQVCEWSLNRYGVAAAIGVDPKLADAAQNPRLDRIKAKMLGIQAQPNGRYHILPKSLDELSRNQQVPDEELPALLHRMEPALEDLDFKHPLDTLFAFYAYFCGLLLIGSCVLLIADPGDMKIAVGCIAFFGFCATIGFGRMVRCRHRKQRQKVDLGISRP